jgi:hypothetical protein
MIFGKKAYESSDQSLEAVHNLLKEDDWVNNDIDGFVTFWSRCLWLTIGGMHKRVENVFANVLNVPNPEVNMIKAILKIKNSRWKNAEINRIAPLIKRFLVREPVPYNNQIDIHNSFQNELTSIGPVLTIWCHYIIEPLSFPPIDKFNYTAWQFITQNPRKIPIKVPNKFLYLPLGEFNTDYQKFRKWFMSILNSWRNDNYTVRDVVDLDKSLMSLGAFIQKNILR